MVARSCSLARGARAELLSVARQKKNAREIKGDVFEGVCGLVFGMVFEGGSKLRRVAKALIPLDIPHLALGKENGVEDLECEAKTETKDRTSTLSRDKPKCHS